MWELGGKISNIFKAYDVFKNLYYFIRDQDIFMLNLYRRSTALYL